jgi:hypothetical protein
MGDKGGLMILIFTFSYNPGTKEAAFAGNIEIQQALPILQSLAIADAVNKARELDKQAESAKIEEGKDATS